MKAIAATEIAGAKKALLPDFVEPSLAYLVPEPPVGEEWLHEIKFDGYRLQARIEAGSVRLLTRSGQDWTPRFANVAQSLKKLKVNSALIDGEVVVQDDKGASSFAMLVDALKAGRSDRMVFFAFDLLYLDGRDLRAATLRNRKRLLEALLATSPKTSRICYSDHLIGDGAAMLRQVCEMGLEGIVAKRADKPYQSGRRGSWVKIKCIQTDEFVIGGYLDLDRRKGVGGSAGLRLLRGDQIRLRWPRRHRIQSPDGTRTVGAAAAAAPKILPFRGHLNDDAEAWRRLAQPGDCGSSQLYGLDE